MAGPRWVGTIRHKVYLISGAPHPRDAAKQSMYTTLCASTAGLNCGRTITTLVDARIREFLNKYWQSMYVHNSTLQFRYLVWFGLCWPANATESSKTSKGGFLLPSN